MCICTSYADLRRKIEAEHQVKLNSRPTASANYCVGGVRRKLPDGPEVGSKRQYVEAGTLDL